MNRVYTIQYLRALAALAVVALHAGKRVQEALPDMVTTGLSLGHAGVDLFFVISGFIMWSISHNKPSDPIGFLLRRLIRIAPPYWVAILVWVAVVSVLNYNWITVTTPHVLGSLAFFPHYSPTFETRIWPVLVPGWTLTYEMFFYLVFAAALLVATKQRLGLLVALFLGLVGAGFWLDPNQAWAVTYTSPLLLEFLGGCLIAELWKRRPGSVARNLLLLLAGFGLLITFGTHVDDADLAHRALVFGGPAVLITLGAVGLGRRVPHLPWLERLGDASYAIYLFHLFLLVPMGEAWTRLPGLHSTPAAFGFIVLTLVLVCFMGLAIYKYGEHPLQKTLNKLFLPKPPVAKPQEQSLANR
ncbi:acyltransferase [Cognatishimia sp. WU-CL00825]|uniref:acyltransferase family protein n=1 Tax=Cognatishimia sp. WU-CL00825 TaxID=3127658 RepID=UPI003103520D